MFGKRTGQPGVGAAPLREAPSAAPPAATGFDAPLRQPTPGVQTEAFAFGGPDDLTAAAGFGEMDPVGAAPPKPDRLDALAARFAEAI